MTMKCKFPGAVKRALVDALGSRPLTAQELRQAVPNLTAQQIRNGLANLTHQSEVRYDRRTRRWTLLAANRRRRDLMLDLHSQLLTVLKTVERILTETNP